MSQPAHKKEKVMTVHEFGDLMQKNPEMVEALAAKYLLGQKVKKSEKEAHFLKMHEDGVRWTRVPGYLSQPAQLDDLLEKVIAKDGPFRGSVVVQISHNGTVLPNEPKYLCTVTLTRPPEDPTKVTAVYRQGGNVSKSGVIIAALLRAMGKVVDAPDLTRPGD